MSLILMQAISLSLVPGSRSFFESSTRHEASGFRRTGSMPKSCSLTVGVLTPEGADVREWLLLRTAHRRDQGGSARV